MSLLEDNIRMIQSQDPALALRLKSVSGKLLNIMPARNSMPTARVGERWIHSAYDPQREAETWAGEAIKEHRAGEAVLLFGVGLLYHVEAISSILTKETTVYVAVPDLREMVDALSVRSLKGWGERVQWLSGEMNTMANRLAAVEQPIRMMAYDPAAALHESSYRALRTILREQVAQKNGGRLRMTVIGPMYGGSLPIARYVVHALEALGHVVSWIDHSVFYSGYQSLGTLRDPRLRQTVQGRFSDVLGVASLAHLAEDLPDVVLALSQAPLSMAVLEQLRRKHVLTAMWFVENFRHFTYWQQLAAGYDCWFVMQQQPCFDAFKQAGARHVTYLPLAADPTIHKPMLLSNEERAEFEADVSFVGAGYFNRRQLFPSLMTPEWSFKIWGNEWENAGSLDAALQRDGARIDTETSVKVFNATDVNVNLHSYTNEGFDPEGDGVNPRTFELAACGAFQLVDDRTLLPELLSPSMLGVIDQADALAPAVRRFLHEPEARRSMADQSRTHVLAHHTYRHRMATLLGELGVQYPDRIGSVLRGDRQAESLLTRTNDCPALTPFLRSFPQKDRVELEDVAATIRHKGPTAVLTRDELLILMMDEYRQEKRDFL